MAHRLLNELKREQKNSKKKPFTFATSVIRCSSVGWKPSPALTDYNNSIYINTMNNWESFSSCARSMTTPWVGSRTKNGY